MGCQPVRMWELIELMAMMIQPLRNIKEIERKRVDWMKREKKRKRGLGFKGWRRKGYTEKRKRRRRWS